MKKYAKEHGYTDMDFIIEEQRSRVQEIAKQLCPIYCCECDELFGNVDVDIIEPFCNILYEKCPNNFHRCPMFKDMVKNINIPSECKICDLMILDICKKEASIYCDVPYCEHYKNTSQWNNQKEDEDEKWDAAWATAAYAAWATEFRWQVKQVKKILRKEK